MFIRLLAVGAAAAAASFFAPSSSVNPQDAVAARVATAANTYNVDGVHSSVIFRVKHMNVAYFYGRFNDISGMVQWNADDPAASSLDIQIAAASVDTANEGRNRHLRSDDFFSAEEHETIRFRSTKIEKAGEKLAATGELTLRGETKEITVELEHTGTANHPRSGREVVGLHAVFTIKRRDFGMNYGVEGGGIGDEVKLMIGIEAVEAQ